MQRQLGLTAAVLQQGQYRRRAAHPLAQLGQRQPARAPDVPEPLAEHAEIKPGIRQGFAILLL